MIFDFREDIEQYFSEIEEDVVKQFRVLTNNIFCDEDDTKKNEALIDEIENSILWKIHDVSIKAEKELNQHIPDEVTDYIINLNNLSFEDQIEEVKRNQDVYYYILEPREEVTEFFNFYYKL